MGPFEFGNTTVRSGARLRDGLIAIQDASYSGTLRGREGDEALIKILNDSGVISYHGDDTRSVGRKWRAAMCKLGFIYGKYDSVQSEIGPINVITPNGNRLVDSVSLAAQQETFLRAMSGLNLSFNGRTYVSNPGFSPLKHILTLMQELDKNFGSSSLSFFEVACFAQIPPSDTSYGELVEEISQYRKGRTEAANKKAFDIVSLDRTILRYGRVRRSTYIDYADENIRYLKATGLFSSVGRGISIAPTKLEIAEELRESIAENVSYHEYWINLTSGAELPTDDKRIARDSLSTLILEARDRNIPFVELKEIDNDIPAMTTARYDLEERIALDKELEYARGQVGEWREIVQYLGSLLKRKYRPEGFIPNQEVEIPRGESPAYLEWTVWRAFLAINRIHNPPFESRNFAIDRDFRPIGFAPGNGPDLVFEFDNYVLVVEVTLLDTDRQSSAELLSVQKHVYQVAKNAVDARPVYSLFLAPMITNMVGKDFKRASFEENDEESLDLVIIPLPIRIFLTFFERIFESGEPNADLIRELIENCSRQASESTTTRHWLNHIERVFSEL